MPLVTGTRSFQPSYILSIQFLASQHHQALASILTQVASAPFKVSLFNTSVSEQHPSQLEKRIQARPPQFQVPNTSALHPHHLSVTSLVPFSLGHSQNPCDHFRQPHPSSCLHYQQVPFDPQSLVPVPVHLPFYPEAPRP